MYIYNKTNNYYFFLILLSLVTISFFIGERSNFLKLFSLLIVFSFLHIFYFNEIKIKKLLLIIPTIIILFLSFVYLVKNTPQGKKFVNFDKKQMIMLKR